MISLPNDLSYLGPIAIHYGPAWRYWSASDACRTERHAQAWRDLAQTHMAICKGEDIVAIIHWLRSAPAASDSRRHHEERRMVRDLLRLLERLGKAGVQPFNQPVLRAPKAALVTARLTPATSGLISTELPTRLRYIVHRARRLGIRPEWDALSSFIDQVDERRFNALVATAHRMRRRGDDQLLRRWLVDSQTTPDAATCTEAQLARGLLHILDALDIF